MCGRTVATRGVEELVGIFGADRVVAEPLPVIDGRIPADDWARPRFNIAPTDPLLVVTQRWPRAHEQEGDQHAPDQALPTDRPVRSVQPMRWGLVPSWSKQVGTRPLINARRETVAEKPSFRTALARRRCLVPVDGYYEWRRSGSARQPYYLHPSGIEPLVMAGLYEYWKVPGSQDQWLRSCVVITGAATDQFGWVHDRMPAQVAPEHWDDWLDPDEQDGRAVLELANLPDPDRLQIHPVATLVNNVRNDGPELLEPIDAQACP